MTSLNSVERYHPHTNAWCSVAPMNKSRSAGAVIACQGKRTRKKKKMLTFILISLFLGFIYALGGHDGLSIFDSVERYDPSTNTWTEATSMLTRRLCFCLLSSKIGLFFTF